METFSTAFSTCIDYVGDVISLITGQAVLTTLFVGGTLVPLAFKIFRKAKRASIG